MANKRVSLKGKGADLFFGDYTPPTLADTPPVDADRAGAAADEAPPRVASPATASAPPGAAAPIAPVSPTTTSATPSSPAPRTTRPAPSESKLASVLASDDVLMQTIRKTVRTPGREVSFVRLSAEEKARLGEIVYAFKRQGQKITETEISRIAVNILVDDYERHGNASLLARILDS